MYGAEGSDDGQMIDDRSRREHGAISHRAASGGDDRRRLAADVGRQRSRAGAVQGDGGRGRNRQLGLRGRQRVDRAPALRHVLTVAHSARPFTQFTAQQPPPPAIHITLPPPIQFSVI